MSKIAFPVCGEVKHSNAIVRFIICHELGSNQWVVTQMYDSGSPCGADQTSLVRFTPDFKI